MALWPGLLAVFRSSVVPLFVPAPGSARNVSRNEVLSGASTGLGESPVPSHPGPRPRASQALPALESSSICWSHFCQNSSSSHRCNSKKSPSGRLEWPAGFPQCSSYSFLLAVRRRSAFLTSCSTLPAYGGPSGSSRRICPQATALPRALSSARRGGRPTRRRRGCRLGPALPVGRRGSTGRRPCRC